MTITVTYNNGRTEGLQKKEFDSEIAYKDWENTMQGIITIILVSRRDD